VSYFSLATDSSYGGILLRRYCNEVTWTVEVTDLVHGKKGDK